MCIFMKRWMTNGLIAVFACVFLVSAFFLVNYFIQSKRAQDQYDYLNSLRNPNYTSPIVNTTGSSGNNDPTTDDPIHDVTKPNVSDEHKGLIEVKDPNTGSSVWLLPEFAQLYQLNTDIVGWISIESTPISYPVMHTPTRPDHYLYRDFYGNADTPEAQHGCIYARESCDIFRPSDNITLYGHMMKDNSMFGYLDRYKYSSYWSNHKYVQFDTLTERHTYEIFAVFKTSGTTGKGFAYHLFDNAQNEEEFNNFVAKCKQLAFYDTGITPTYGDKLITLSTCEYTIANGRLVVVAKRIS